MKSHAHSFRPAVEVLEVRDTPAAAVVVSDSFETPITSIYPAGWVGWSNTGNGILTTKAAAATGQTSVASAGTALTTSRLYESATEPADDGVSIKVRADAGAPAQVIARGANLGTVLPTYVAATLAPGGSQVSLVEVVSGVARTLGTVAAKSLPATTTWLQVILQPQGASATVEVKRGDTGQYLNAQGTWQTVETTALQSAVTVRPVTGQVGIGRGAGGTGTVYFDDFTVTAAPTSVSPLPPTSSVPVTVSPPVVSPPASPPPVVVSPPPVSPPSPPASPPPSVVSDSFDATAAGTRSATWQSWTSDGTVGFVASSARAVTGNGYADTGSSVTAARSWLTAAQPADVQASASFYADTLIPGVVLVRGSNLNTATPTYYGLSVTRGLSVSLVSVVNGVQTTLGAVASASYVSSVWLRLTLVATGSALRAVIVRADTGQWLTPSGAWSDTPQPALDVTNSKITGSGSVGVGRSKLAAGTVSFDDFQVKPASSTSGPVVTVAPSQPGTVAGTVTFTATGSPTAPPARIEFQVDGVTKSASAAAAASYAVDTTLLTNGTHTVTVRAIDAVGNVTTVATVFTVANAPQSAAPAVPDLASHYSHIRIAALAYAGNPMGTFEQSALQSSVDLVVSNPQYLATVNQTAAATPQLIYTNVSNLYQGLLTGWLNYADQAGVSRESAFYHVAQATPFSGGSPSSQPVNYFWNVNRGSSTAVSGLTDLTSAAHGGQSTGVAFGAAGQAVSVGYPDEFRELNFTLSKGAAAGWTGVIQYPTAVAADGTPTAWKTLTLVADGTAGLTKSGQVTFDPPADWVTAKLSGYSDRLYYVRVLTTSGASAAAPVASTILGRDYVGANGGTSGTIPAFDYAADANHDGYLSDAEYANRAPGDDARFAYESRLFYPNYGQMRFATNPSSAAVQQWAAGYTQQLLAQNPLADGVFIDNASGKLSIAGTSVIESTATYAQDTANLTAAVWKAVAPKLVFTNTAGGGAAANAVAAASTEVFEENVIRAMDSTWASVNDLASLVAGRLAAGSEYVVLDSYPGSSATTDPRLQLATLAEYYLVADPDRTMISFFGGADPAAAWSTTWIAAATVDVGQPTGSMTVVASGADPENAALKYQVFGRTYGNALVLYKPRSYATGVGTGTTDDATATAINLGGSYRALNADGSLGPVVTSISLRNAEGAVLIKA